MRHGFRWTLDDLASFNIQIEYVKAKTFFGKDVDELPSAQVDDAFIIITGQSHTSMTQRPAHIKRDSEDIFVTRLLQMSYETLLHAVTIDRDVSPVVCGKMKYLKAQTCVQYIRGQGCPARRWGDRGLSREQLEKEKRISGTFGTKGESPLSLNSMEVIPGIVTTRTSPSVFYLIPVTSKLSTSIINGQWPKETTKVLAHVPETPTPTQNEREAMDPLDNKAVILRCYEAFKEFVFEE
ncbi:hypothetical protein K439DRAFT_1659425 [Ramaria rubella]|nr:hypothetical protein K439DRAFT_1659425 [Ramaria rubella]